MLRKRLLGMLLIGLGMVLPALAPWLGKAGAASIWEGSGQPDLKDRVIRLHVVASSDSEADQALKRAVRDAILDRLTPRLQRASSPEEARALVQAAIPEMEETARAVIRQWGKDDGVHAEFGRFAFPARAYGDFFLPAGEYTALKLIIGQGRGANWWCVLFPPLCFTDWSVGLVREPKPGSGGAETVTVPRPEPPVITEDALRRAPVRARSALYEWLKGRIRSRQTPARPVKAQQRGAPSRPL